MSPLKRAPSRWMISGLRPVVDSSLPLLISALLLSGCDKSDNTAAFNRWQWKSDAAHTCSKIGSLKYCFPDKDIVASSLDSDYSAGFLIAVPIRSDPVLLKCNLDDTRLNATTGRNGGLYISLLFGDVEPTDTFLQLYQREYGLATGSHPYSDIRLGPPVSIYGKQCAYTTSPNLTHKDFICRTGSISDGGLASILSCSKLASIGEDGYPNPDCTDNLYTANSHYKITYNRNCLMHADRIRALVTAYVERARVRLGGK
jgi:hypothetical protein